MLRVRIALRGPRRRHLICKGKPCELPFCSYRERGAALSKKKREPSVRGRDEREAAHMALHPYCEACKIKPSVECHHVGGRGMGGAKRKTAELQALCFDCHQVNDGKGHSTARR